MHASRRRTTVLILWVILALLLLVLHQTGQLLPFENLALTLMQPILGGSVTMREQAEGLSGTFGNVSELRAQIAQLQSQVDEMTTDTVRLRELENEVNILRQQLGYAQSNPDYGLTGAIVLGRNPDFAGLIGIDPSNLIHSIIIDQGDSEGVKKDMPVITPQGLVGRVIQVGMHWSKVLLIIDPSSSVSAVVQSTRATGVVRGVPGDANGSLLMKYVPQGEAIKVGDTILTSGLGGNFPKRLVIGTVTEVHKQDIELFQEAVIRPSVDFSRLELLLVLKKYTPADITSEPTPTRTATPKPTRTPAP